MSQDTQKPRRGRPPSAAARARALAAAQEILLRDGFGRLSIEAVAAASGTGKPTIYRHWANTQELAMEALIADAPDPASPAPDLPPLEALTAQLERLVSAFGSTRGRQITQALASADPDSEFTRAFRNRVILASREAGRARIEHAVSLGQLRPPPDTDVLLDMIYGPLFFRLLAGHLPLDDGLARAIPATLMDLLGSSPD